MSTFQEDLEDFRQIMHDQGAIVVGDHGSFVVQFDHVSVETSGQDGDVLYRGVKR